MSAFPRSEDSLITVKGADMCIAEATRQGCCDPLAAQWQLVKGDCSLDASTCECTC